MIRFILLGLFFVGMLVSVVSRPPVAVLAELAPTQSATAILALTQPPVAGSVTAVAYGVFDVKTGELLLGENVDESRPIASVTKLFTAAATLRATSVPEQITISSADVATEGESGSLQAGDTYELEELLFPLLLESSNDAATALGRVLGEIPFADRSFDEPSGLDASNQASVKELGRETRQLYLQMPHIFDITRLSKYVGEKAGWVNNSPVRELPGYLGGKHGYTSAAGRTLVAFFSEPAHDDRTLQYVLLGSSDLRADVEVLRAMVAESVHLQ